MRRRVGADDAGDRSAGEKPVLVATMLAAVAALSLLVSFVVHARWGHGANSVEPMRFGELLRQHPAFTWAALCVALAGLFARRPGARERDLRSNTRG